MTAPSQELTTLRVELSCYASGRPLAPGIQAAMERALGADLSDVRIHLGGEAGAIGALAFASGSHVYFDPDYFNPYSFMGRWILAHELVHVLQQRARRVSSPITNSTTIIHDHDLESEADWHGFKAAMYCEQHLPASAIPDSQMLPYHDARTSREIQGPSGVAIQPWIKMAKDTNDDPEKYGTIDYHPPLNFPGYFKEDKVRGESKPIEERFVLLTNFDETWTKVTHAMKFLFGDQALLVATVPLRATLDRWMGVVPLARREQFLNHMKHDVLITGDTDYDVRREAGVIAEIKYFFTYGELAWALMREIEVGNEENKESVLAEEALAQIVLKDRRICKQLELLRCQLDTTILKDSALLDWCAQNKDKLPAYGKLHGEQAYPNVLNRLSPNNEGLDVATQIALLHDLKDLLFWTEKIPRDSRLPMLLKTEKREIETDKMRMRYNLGTPDEADDWVLFHRERKRPIWAGPSYTMSRMCQMAELVGATVGEQTAMAYAIFAYWAVVYPLTSTPIHRFHEVMIAASYFGVPYNPELSAMENFENTSAMREAKL